MKHYTGHVFTIANFRALNKLKNIIYFHRARTLTVRLIAKGTFLDSIFIPAQITSSASSEKRCSINLVQDMPEIIKVKSK